MHTVRISTKVENIKNQIELKNKINEIMPFAATWMGLEIIISILSEARERQIM